MSVRHLLALWGVLFVIVASAASAAAASGKTDPLARRNWGTVTGYVLDRDTGRPITGARVAVEHDGSFAEQGRTVGTTDKDGRYRVQALLGRKRTRFDLMSLVEGFPIALIMPWGLFKQTRAVDARQCLLKVGSPGYKTFLGVVAAQVVSAKRYGLHCPDVLLASEASLGLSMAPPDRPRETLLTCAIEPQIAAPGDKVTFTARLRLPQDGVRYFAGWYSPDKFLKFSDIPMKAVGRPGPENMTRDFQATVEIPRRPRGDWATFRLWLDRDRKYNEAQLPGVREVLLQVARTPEERESAKIAVEAFAFEQEDRLAEALQRYRQAAAIAPARASLWARIGNMSLRLNRSRDAVTAYEKLVAADPDHREVASAYLASALLVAGEYKRALETLAAVEKKADKNKRLPREFLLAMARAYLACDDLRNADRYYARAVKIGRVPNDIAQQFTLERARAAASKTPGDPDARQGLARALFELRRYEEAIAEYRRAIRQDPNNVWMRLDLAACLAAQDRDREAIVYYRQAAAMAPDNLEARLALADCSRRLGDFPAALEAYRRVAASPARRYDFRVQHGLGLMLLAMRKEKEAMEALQRAVDLARQKGRLHTARFATGFGVLSLTPKRVTIDGFDQPEAVLDYVLLESLRELQAHPESALTRYRLGMALIELGLSEQGLAALQEAESRGILPGDARCAMAAAYLRLGRRAEARQILDDLLREDPENQQALLALARLYFDSGDTAAAQACLARARAGDIGRQK